MSAKETPQAREARLLAEAEAELETEKLHLFQESLATKSESNEAGPGRMARALFRLGFQSKLSGVDSVTLDNSSKPESSQD